MRWYSRRYLTCLRIHPGCAFAAIRGVGTLTADAPADKPKRNRRKKSIEQVDAAVAVPVPAADYVPAPRFVPTAEHAAVIAQFSALYPFPLDSFQQESIAALVDGVSVMVAAPTGTGKTVVAEFASMPPSGAPAG